MNIFDTILWPIKWVIEAILVGWHWFLTNVLQLDASAGLTWVLAIVGLTVVVRAALIPIFVRQIKSQLGSGKTSAVGGTCAWSSACQMLTVL